MGKKGRPKPKAKQTGKKRSKGKQAVVRRATKARGLTKNIDNSYFTNRSEYEPVRNDDFNEVGEQDIQEVDEEERDEEEGDLDIFRQPETDYKFLTAVNLEDYIRPNKKKRKALENVEEPYEKQPRLSGEAWYPQEHILLPLKGKNGVIQQSTKPENDDPSNIVRESTTVSGETGPEQLVANDVPCDESFPTETLSAVDLLKIREDKINQKKLLIINLVSSILEDPYANVEKLNEMNKLCEEKDSDISVTICKLAIVSLLEVFKDIIPGYHIRPLSESEKTVKVSKDVKKVRKFEQGLLQSYQKYLQILERIIKERKIYKKSRKLAQKSLSMVALNCFCDLLISVPHFNFRTNIMAVLVPRMNDKSGNDEVSKLSCQTIHSIFKADSAGEISLEIVQLISKFVKSQSFKVKPCVLETFLSLRLQEADLGKDDRDNKTEKPKHKNRLEKAKKKRMSKNDRKRAKELKKLEHELQEVEAVEGKEKSRKWQTEIIKLVFSIYFRVLKTSGVSPLLAPVLAGLSKYTHLINVDFFADLMAVLRSLVNSEEISSSDKLHCILTAFKILSGQGEALNIDPQTFYSHLYSTLLNISPVSTDSEVPVALQCLDVMLNKRRKQVSIQRLLAYIKRLCTVSLQQSPSTSLALLSCTRSFLQMHAKAGIILDSDCSGSGVLRPDIPDPEYSNADSTTLWELAIFHNHYEPTLRNLASNISLGNPSQGPGSLPTHIARKSPVALFEEYEDDKQLLRILDSGPVTKAPALAASQKTSSKKISFGFGSWSQSLIQEVHKCDAWLAKQEIDVDFGNLFSTHD